MNFDIIWAYVLVFVLAAVPFFEAAIISPIAVVAGLSIVPVILLAIVGNLLTVYIVILFIDKLKNRFMKNKEKSQRRADRARKIFAKYGVAGVALIGPFFIGSHLSAFLSLLFGGTKKTVTVWMTISIVLWSAGLAILASYGVTFFNMEGTLVERFFNTNN